ncbi:MAG TPA: ABC transporter permease [Magnetospirillaceae bacterium]|nr:ABC transporter permease [Magnetospirillaceae bacterium]
MNPVLGALELILSGDREVFQIAGATVRFSFWSTVFSTFPGLVLGIWLAGFRFPGRRAIAAVISSLTALPTVVIGLFVYYLISRAGPLGHLGWLFSPPGVVLGQTILALPIVVNVVYTGLSKLDPRFTETLVTLGAGKLRRLTATLFEAKYVLASALLNAFGRVTGEVGVSMMLGGNIRWYTRTMTTTIALDTSKGDFDRALSQGILLLTLSLTINALVHAAVKHEQ